MNYKYEATITFESSYEPKDFINDFCLYRDLSVLWQVKTTNIKVLNKEEVEQYEKDLKLKSLLEQKEKIEKEIRALTGTDKKVSCREEDCPCHIADS